MDLGDKIKSARTQKGFTQKELAEKTGLTVILYITVVVFTVCI